MGVRIGATVERVNGKELSYADFAERYLKPNRPVLLTGLMDAWTASRDWVSPDSRPNLSFFSAQPFSKSIVQVADCDERELSDQKRIEMSVSDFVERWRGNSDAHSLLYLKDWHFVKEYPGYVAYTTPAFFNDDWLNIYLDRYHVHQDSGMHDDKKEVNCADYRFVYMGAKGTWTPLHADVFRSYSWSANEDTISINHNWFNAYNLSWVWNLLLKDYKEAKEYIEDIRDICDNFESLCQRNLAANTGLNFYDLFVFITRIALANLVVLYHLSYEDHSASEPSSSALHLTRNVMSIRAVASSMKSAEAFAEENLNSCSEENRTAFADLESYLVEPEFVELCATLMKTYKSIEGQEQDCDFRNSCICTKDLLKCLNGGTENLDVGSKIDGPGDLVRLIDCAISKQYNILPSDVCDWESQRN